MPKRRILAGIIAALAISLPITSLAAPAAHAWPYYGYKTVCFAKWTYPWATCYQIPNTGTYYV